jgi:hypothetical protein
VFLVVILALVIVGLMALMALVIYLFSGSHDSD